MPDFKKIDDPELDKIKHLRTPVQFFKLFVTPEFIKETLHQTKLYAEQTGKLGNWKKSDRDEILSEESLWNMIGISLVMGYNTLPSRAHYWERRADTFNLLLAETMR